MQVDQYERRMHLYALAGAEVAEMDFSAAVHEWLESKPEEVDVEDRRIRDALGIR